MRKFLAILALILTSVSSKAQLVNNNAFLQGNYVEVGIAPCGSFGSSVNAPTGYHPRGGSGRENQLGFIADVGRDGWAAGSPNYVGDYFLPATPEEGWGLTVNGTNYNNNLICGSTSNNIQGSFINYNKTTGQASATWLGYVAGLSITAKTYIPVNSLYFITEVTIQNTTNSSINNIYYMRNVDPDQGIATPGSSGSYVTTNTVVYQTPNACNQALVSATVGGNLYLGLGSIDSRARVTMGGFSNRSASEIWTGISSGSEALYTSGTRTEDRAISVSFNVGTLAPNQSTKLAYAYVLDASQLSQALAATNINLDLSGVNYSTGNTTNICSGTAVPINLSNTGTFTSWSWAPATGLNTTTGTSVIATLTSPVTYTATGTGACGTTSVNITLNPVIQSTPASAGSISGLSVIGLGQTNVTYSCAAAANATYYKWDLPPGAVVASSRSDSNVITFNAPNTTWSGDISVQPKNSCGAGASSIFAVSISNIATGSVSSPVCAGSTINVPISIPLGYFLSGNVFTAQLSDSSGSFASPVNIGTLASASSSFISSLIPLNTIAGTGYRIRVISSNPVTTGTDNGSDIIINAAQTPDIKINANQTNVCAGTTITFSSIVTGAGSSPAYQWIKNGSNAGTNSATYTDASFVAGDQVSCIVTGNAACFAASKDTSNIITLSAAPGTPSVNITADKASICAGTMVTFTATATNSGINPVYQWRKNGANVGSNSSIYTDNSIGNSDIITCVLTSNATCATATSAISNNISVTVNANVTPSVSITASQSSVCSGNNTTITFTANAVNGGSSPVYQWKKNGVNVGTNSATYATNTLGSSDVFTCVLTSNAGCVTTNTATSNSVSINITPAVIPGIVISASQTTICTGSTPTVTFTAIATNGGSSPVYQWKKNGVNVGTNSATYITSVITNGTTIECSLRSNETSSCLATDSVSSNIISMLVTSPLTPSISISTPSSSVCTGSVVTFSATIFNGGTSPSYQWRKNGINVGLNQPTYTDSTFVTNDVVSCILTSNAPCLSTTTATSNNIFITAGTPVTPSVTISASQTTICTGTTPTITFTPIPVNGGTLPSYRWSRNGVGLITTPGSFSTSSFVAGDVITCVMTSSAGCVTSTTANSNSITLVGASAATPSISIVASRTTLCSGQSVTFTPIPVNGGSLPSYLWYRNGTPIASGSTFTTASLVNGDVITCNLTSSLSCVSSSTALSNGITMTVNPSVTPTVSITASQSTICPSSKTVVFTAISTNGGTAPIYQWYKNGTAVGINSSTYTDTALTSGSYVYCSLISNLTSSCLSSLTATSNSITIYSSSVTPYVSITTPSSSVCSGAAVTFTATATNGGTSPVYQWSKNGVNVGTNSNTYTDNALQNTDVINCILTSNALCIITPTTTSNSITMYVSPSVTPSVTISATQTTICTGTTPTITFTATAVNGGNSPIYEWRKNGIVVYTSTFYSTYSASGYVAGDVVTCTITSNAACATSTTAVSNSITITSAASATPSLNIVASATNICTGTYVTFTAVPVNGGTSPYFQWYRNGVTYSSGSVIGSSSFVNGDVITCVMTGSLSCATASTATSNSITMTVTANVTPSITITASQINICPTSRNVLFTAVGLNGGTAPVYQWRKNNSIVGTNSNVFSDSTLIGGDYITCTLISSITSPCLTSRTVVSNTIYMSYSTLGTPSVSISASSTNICSGTSVSFTATPVNGGTSPTYQWSKNGINVGTNSNTYTDNGLSNYDIVTCTLISNAACINSVSAMSNTVTMYVTPTVTPTVTIAASQTTVCSGSSVSISFTATALNAGGSPTYEWRKNGVVVYTSPYYNTYSGSGFVAGDVITCTVTSNNSCTTAATAVSNTITITNGSTIPSVSIIASATNVCSGTYVTFTAVPVNGGSSAYFQWYRNGIAYTTGNSFSAYTLLNGDVITCVMTGSLSCATATTATSNSIVMTVNPYVTPSVSIVASQTNICPSSRKIIFTANALNGGTAPIYQWRKDGVAVGTNSATYTDSTMTGGNYITCTLISSTTSTCINSRTVTSNSIYISTTTTVTPSVSISVSSNSICSGTSVTFTAIPVNGGISPSYQWKKNGINVGTNAGTYTDNALSNYDVINCILTSNASCLTTANAISNNVIMTVTPTLTPTVTISASQTTICTGSSASITFTATALNAGSPSYEWRKNGIVVYTSTYYNTYGASGIVAGDVITCTIAGTASCMTSATAVSNSLTIGSAAAATPSVTIVASQTSICSGNYVLFTAIPVNGGTSPSYQWFINGVYYTSGSSFSSYSLVNSDVVTCSMTSSLSCRTVATVTSNSITMTVNAIVTPSVTVTASHTNICPTAKNVTFNAVVINGGTAPIYQWRRNGNPVGTNSSTYSDSTLLGGDYIDCYVISNTTSSCITTRAATSNSISISYSTLGVPSVYISSNLYSVCSGRPLTFTATPTNGGTAPSYQWRKNGVNAGTNSSTYTDSTFINNDLVTCIITSNASCISTTTATSNAVTVYVNPSVTPSLSISSTQSVICTGTTPSITFTATAVNAGYSPVYNWSKNGVLVSSSTSGSYTTSSLVSGDVVNCSTTSTASCALPATVTSNSISLSAAPSATPSVTITSSNASICSGNYVTLIATPINGGTSPSYQWRKNGVIVQTSFSNSYSTYSVVNGDVFTCTLTSSLSCVTGTATSSPLTLTILPYVTPTVTITASQTSICPSGSVTFTATPANGGTAPTYEWRRNGYTIAGANAAIYTTNAVSNGDYFTCVITSNAPCAASTTASSNLIYMTVNGTLPTVSVSSSSSTLCAGTSTATFTATGLNGGTTPSYQWRKNGVNAGTNSNIYVPTDLVNGDTVTCVFTSSTTCAAPVISNAIVIKVITVGVPVVVSPVNINCGSSAILNATPSAGNSLRWFTDITGGTAFATGNTTSVTPTGTSNYYAESFSALSSSRVTAISATGGAVIDHNSITGDDRGGIAISPNYVYITGDNYTGRYNKTDLSGGTSLTLRDGFFSNLSNGDLWQIGNSSSSGSSLGGGSITHLYKLNESLATTGVTLTLSQTVSLSSGNFVAAGEGFVILYSGGIANHVNLSNGLVTRLSSSLSFSFSGSESWASYGWAEFDGTNYYIIYTYGSTIYKLNVSTGTSTTLQAFSSLGDMAAIVFDPQLNRMYFHHEGSSQFGGSSETLGYTGVTATSASSGCSSTRVPVVVNVTSTLVPSVTIASSATSVASGTSVTFTATPVNGGTLPSYQWRKNGINVGGTSNTYTSATLVNGDVISCVLTSNAACITTANATSNSITMTVTGSGVFSVSGRVITPTNQPIPGAKVSLSSTPKDSIITTISGAYAFGLPSTGTFTITPSKNNDIIKASGVNVLDVILTQYHILGRQLLNTPYKIIAADVNNDGTINIFDVLFSKRLILGVDSTFAGNRLWAFVDSSYVFADPAAPFPYSSSKSYTSLSSSQANQSFIGLKLGDVNQDLVPSVGVNGTTSMKTPLQLYYDTASADGFGNVRLKIRSRNFRELLGLQFTLGFNSSVLEYGGVESGSIAMEYGKVNLKDGALTFIWNDAANAAKTFADGTVLFELVLKKKGFMQNEDISIDSRFTPAVAYDKDLAAHTVIKGYGIIMGDEALYVKESMQVSPNPSRGPVKIKIISSSFKPVTILVTDALGRVLVQKRTDLVTGTNEINLNLHQNAKLAQGIYYIRANGLDGKAAKEVMVIE